jgi:hypothetical protein
MMISRTRLQLWLKVGTKMTYQQTKRIERTLNRQRVKMRRFCKTLLKRPIA